MQITKLFSDETIAILKKYKNLKAILLFGSYVKNQDKAEDVDIAFLGEISFDEALTLFEPIQSYFKKELDWVIFNRGINDILAFEIIMNHKILYVTDEDYVADLFSLMLRKHEDEKKVRDKFFGSKGKLNVA